MTFRSKARRAGWLLVVAAFAFGIVSAIRPTSASAAYGLISTRSVQMSSSDASGANGSGLGTNVIYKVSFTTATANANFASILIRICSNNPIIGDGCLYPTGWGFDWNKSTLSINGQTGVTNLAVSASSTSNYLLLTRATPGPIAAGTAISFSLGDGSTNGVTNPTTLGTFFARVMLFNTTTPTIGTTTPGPTAGVTTDDYSTGTAANRAYDAGGAALSTTNVLNVTAKVQEALTFCVHTGTLCTDGGNAVLLGDTNNVLANMNQNYIDSSPKIDVASNALGGVLVRMKTDTLKSGTFSITEQGGPGCTADLTTTSSEQFGVRVVSYGTGQFYGDATTGNQTPDGGANDFTCNSGFHKLRTADSNTTYGQNFIRTIGATDVSTSNIELAAKAANTTEAGVYTTKMMFIATATY